MIMGQKRRRRRGENGASCCYYEVLFLMAKMRWAKRSQVVTVLGPLCNRSAIACILWLFLSSLLIIFALYTFDAQHDPSTFRLA